MNSSYWDNSVKLEVRTNKITDKTNVRVRSVSLQDHFHVMSQNHHHYNQHQYRRNCMPELCSYCSDYATCRMMRDSHPGKDKIVSSSSRGRPGRLWGPLSLLLNGYRILFLGQSGRCMKFAKRLHLLPRLRTSGALPLLPLRTFMVWKGTYLPFHQHMCITSLVILVPPVRLC